ncbi:DUF6660 family protein [Pedobacter sp. GSP4]|uniref:DUF6660 family protein n=1 Tax=Pedobacter sp. GSP4 TaxID=3453716 RepID=UPI003EE970CE
MKILVYLLSIGMLLISCITCEDVSDFGYNSQAKISLAKLNKTEHTAEKDNCSPMCTCNCCGQPTVNNLGQSVYVFPKHEVVVKLKTPYHNQFLSSYAPSIWQPPKLNNTVIG